MYFVDYFCDREVESKQLIRVEIMAIILLLSLHEEWVKRG